VEEGTLIRTAAASPERSRSPVGVAPLWQPEVAQEGRKMVCSMDARSGEHATPPPEPPPPEPPPPPLQPKRASPRRTPMTGQPWAGEGDTAMKIR
jgi:hypothetical protein